MFCVILTIFADFSVFVMVFSDTKEDEIEKITKYYQNHIKR